MDSRCVKLTTPTLFKAFCKLYRISGSQPVSFDNLTAYLRQTGFVDGVTGSLEAEVRAGLQRLLGERRILSTSEDVFVPVALWPQPPQLPFFPAFDPARWTSRSTGPVVPPWNFDRMPFQHQPHEFDRLQDPWPAPPFYSPPQRRWQPSPLTSPRHRETSSAVPIQHYSTTPTNPANKASDINRPISQSATASTTSPNTTDDEDESGDDSCTRSLANTSFPTAMNAPFHPSTSLRQTSNITSSGSSSGDALATSALTTMGATTASDELPRPFRYVAVSPNEFERFVSKAISESKKKPDGEEK